MNNNLFLQGVAEVKISYSINIPPSQRRKISGSKDAADIFRHIFPGLEHREYFYVMLLTRNNQVLGYYEVSKGGITGTIVDVRLILQAALKSNSSGIILAHCHPSGNLDPSDADLRITRKIKDAAQLMDISVLDHLILTEHSFTSLADNGML